MLHSTVSPVSETFDPLERGLVAGAESHEFELIGTEYDGASNSDTPRNKTDDFQEDEDISERRFWPVRDGIVHGISVGRWYADFLRGLEDGRVGKWHLCVGFRVTRSIPSDETARLNDCGWHWCNDIIHLHHSWQFHLVVWWLWIDK